jgi:glucosylceramidase
MNMIREAQDEKRNKNGRAVRWRAIYPCCQHAPVASIQTRRAKLPPQGAFAMHSRFWAAPAVLLGACLALSAQQVHCYETSADLSRKLQPQPMLRFSPISANQAPALTITVDDAARFQTIDGFGASITDGAAWLLQQRLSAADRESVMVQLFDPERGIGLSFLRQPIGSTDLSRSHSSFDDMPSGEQDPDMKHFSTAHDQSAIFPTLREALKLNPAITVMATPWSPPAWMKTGGSMDGGQLRDDALPAYAAYLTRSVEAFQSAGIPVKYLSVQNEPLNETHDYPGTLMQAPQQARFIARDLGPDLARAGLTTKILAYDHNWDHPEYPLAVLSDPQAAPFLAGSALHCYRGDVSAQNAIHEKYPDKGIWMTECSGGTWDKEAPLIKTARLLIESTRNWAKAVVLWGLVLDTDHGPHDGGCGTCRPLVTVDLHGPSVSYVYTGDYYGIGHAGKFVRPGATRIGSNSFGVHSLQTVAFQNTDRSIALLVLNNGAAAASLHVRWRDQEFLITLGAGTLATYIWPWPPSMPR